MEHVRDDLASKVLMAKTPKEAKLIASEVKVPDSWWEDARFDIMRDVLTDKIASSSDFRDALINTGDDYLVEALADPYWGCGLPYHLAITTHPDHYTGSNKLGLLLMELRSEMRKYPSLYAPSPHIEENTPVSSAVAARGRTMKKRGSTIRISGEPSSSKSQKTSTTPLIREAFKRQSVKRPRRDHSTSPTRTPTQEPSHSDSYDDITTADPMTDDVTQVDSTHVSKNTDVIDNR